MKKLLSMLLTVFMLVSLTSFCCYAETTEELSSVIEDSDALFWTEQEAEDCKFYATIDGVYRECTREEYAMYGVRYYIQDYEVTKDEYYEYLKSINKKNIKVDSTKIKNVTPMRNTAEERSLDLLAKWNFTSLSMYECVDTNRFTYYAGNSNQRATLNLRQWTSSNSTNPVTLRYQVLHVDSYNNIIRYCDERLVTGYYPNSSSVDAAKLQVDMNVNSIDDIIVRATSLNSYDVSGFGQIYNY